ncbi:helix-turn-helix transcriptional regulator [Mycolicibacterium neoaurum]|uniref:helix-turn-helix domain-containing protein n=1 Tax=Mycolicibacterium neoaurum TaxID=1795 RepID=UPI002672915D|nr:helix-turn-helix transcriptional regulator [Mycolicibacterium neoaurum]MDO3401925.1 helix-turn-helix transcriptional regulator [Mycolicibacterium neoaurum]
MENEDPAQRLGRFVRVRRKELKLTQADVQNADGPSPATLRLIEAGKHADLRRSTVEPLERILGWEPGSVQAVLDGGSPIYEMHIDDNLREKFHIAPGKITSGGMPRPPRGPSRPVTEAEILGIDETTIDLSISPETRGGVDSLRAAVTRSAILKIPEGDRSVEEAEWLAAYEAAHPRQLDPRIYRTGERRPPEAIFDDWQAARNRMLNVVLEYAATRKISFQAAEEELADVQQMASDVQLDTGRPWTPPWNPGAEFREGETPWKREWWAIIEQNIGGISTIGHSYDVEKVRRNRAGDEQRAEEWEAHRRSQLSKCDAEEASRIPGSRLVRATLDGLETETIIPPGTAPVDDTALTQGLHRARVDAKAIETQHFALEDLLEKSRAFPTERVDDEVVDTAMAQFLLAVERYVIATDLLIRGFQNADLHASAEPIDVAINAFDFYAKVAASYVPFLESLAGNVQSEVQRRPVERTRRSLVTLIEWLDKTRDAWIDSGLSKTRSPSVLQHLTAARTAAQGYKPGQSEQGDAGGEENQDPGGSH